MEIAILQALQSMRIDGIVQLAALISSLGDKGFIWIVMMIVCAFMPDKRSTAVMLFVTLVGVLVISEIVLEPMVARVRPCNAGVGIVAVPGVSHDGYSFPSGHALSSFACSIVIAMTCGKKWGVPFVTLAVVISLTRLYLGVHYPSDVLAGAIIGAAIALAVVWLFRKLFPDLNDRLSSININRKSRKGMHSR